MKILFSSILSLLVLCSYGQETKKVMLKVYGTCSAMSEKIGQSISIKVIVDNNKCDPEIGFISMEDRLFHFEEALSVKGVKFEDFERSFKSGRSGAIATEIFNYVGTEDEIQDVIDVALRQEIEITNVTNRYEKKTLEDQDDSAICALAEVTRKANYIAESLGYQNCVLMAIDDDSTTGGSLISILETMSVEDILAGGSIYSIIGYFEMY